MTPIYTAFYTRRTRYADDVQMLIESLRAWSLDFHIEDIDDLGSWTANSRYTARHMLAMVEQFADRPVVYLDADAIVWKYPALFEQIADADAADIAAHHVGGRTFANGTVYLAPTAAAKAVVKRYVDLIDADPACTNEQIKLAAAVADLNPRFIELPADYCHIDDFNGHEVSPGGSVIQHYQASRETGGGEPLERRRKWLAEARLRLASQKAA